jgi:hypothetical protein
MSTFSKAGLQTLAATYQGGTAQQADEQGAFEYLLGNGPRMPSMSVIKWDITMLLCNMVMIVDPVPPMLFCCALFWALSLPGSVSTGLDLINPVSTTIVLTYGII